LCAAGFDHCKEKSSLCGSACFGFGKFYALNNAEHDSLQTIGMHCGKKKCFKLCVYGAYPSCTSGNNKYEDLKANPSINWENAVWYQHAATLPFLF